MYALSTIQKMNTRAAERQAAQSAILAEFVFHVGLARRLKLQEPEKAAAQLRFADDVYRNNPGLQFRMDQVAPWFLMLIGERP